MSTLTQFYDYKTAPVVGSQVIDLHRTGMPYYDDFLSKNSDTIEYLKREKNLVGNVVNMTPKEYFRECSNYGFPNSHPSVDSLIQDRQRDTKTLEHLKDVLLVYKRRFPMPILNKAHSAQEGLHRMLVVAELFGWDHEVPVLVVDWADKQRAFDEQKRKRTQKIEQGIKRAVDHMLLFTFADFEQMKEQLQWELDNIFDYEEDLDVPVKFELTSSEESFIVTIGSASYEFDKDSVNFADASDYTEEDLFIDDDFLRRYFGDNWQETDPHLKDLLNIKESIERLDIKEMDQYIKNHFGSSAPGDGCIFIASDGTFINIYPQLDDHEDLSYWLEDQGFDNNPNDADWFVDVFKYVRCRNSPHLCFIELPQECTSKQFYSIQDWLELKVSCESIQVAVPDNKWKEYDLKQYFPEDIMKFIKRFYSSGILHE